MTPELKHLGIAGPIERIFKPREVPLEKYLAQHFKALRPATTCEILCVHTLAFMHKRKLWVNYSDLSSIGERFTSRVEQSRHYDWVLPYLRVSTHRVRKGPIGKMLPLEVAMALMRGDTEYPSKN